MNFLYELWIQGMKYKCIHAIVSDGYFLEDGRFKMAPGFMLEDLEEAFQYEVFKKLKKEGKINDAIIENMLSWYHSGFHVYIGDRIEPHDKKTACRLCQKMGVAPISVLVSGQGFWATQDKGY